MQKKLAIAMASFFTLIAPVAHAAYDRYGNWYDDSRQEPEILPTRFPNLLINGASGIAVGMATNIPPHNLTEIVNATIALVRNPQTPLTEILTTLKSECLICTSSAKASETNGHSKCPL